MKNIQIKPLTNFTNIDPNIQFLYHFDLGSPAVSDMKRETTRIVGAATKLFIRMHHFFTTGVIKSFSKETGKQIYLSRTC